MTCRHCDASLNAKVLELLPAPPSNAYLRKDQLDLPETYYPLRLFLCEACGLVQTQDFHSGAELFDAEYVYFSSTSRNWLAHAERFCAEAVVRLALSAGSFVVEVASNDGYLLKNFVAAGIPCLGVEPTASTAAVARLHGIETRGTFFGQSEAQAILAEKGRPADLIVGNNVLAHVPDINDFVAGLRTLLAPEGVVSLEFPHLLNLVKHAQFDTVYHEHFSYLSLTAVERIFQSNGLKVIEVAEIPTHGGSLRVWGARAEAQRHPHASVDAMLRREAAFGLAGARCFDALQAQADASARALLTFLVDLRARGQSVLGYGAAAKGTTLLNHARISADLLPAVVDAAPFKQGRYLPGCRIPVVSPDVLSEAPPAHLLILPWNIKDEIAASFGWLRESHGTQFWTVTPTPEIFTPVSADAPPVTARSA